MKCPECGEEQEYKERANGSWKCFACGYVRPKNPVEVKVGDEKRFAMSVNYMWAGPVSTMEIKGPPEVLEEIEKHVKEVFERYEKENEEDDSKSIL